ncbi:MAG: hypothetical protein ACOCTQ_03670, partial [Planctomycetota bacterium]
EQEKKGVEGASWGWGVVRGMVQEGIAGGESGHMGIHNAAFIRIRCIFISVCFSSTNTGIQ